MIPKKEVTVKPKNFFKLYLIICFVKIYIKIVSWIVFDIKYEEMFIKVKTFALRKTLKKKSYFRYINLSKAHSGSHIIHQKNQIWLKKMFPKKIQSSDFTWMITYFLNDPFLMPKTLLRGHLKAFITVSERKLLLRDESWKIFEVNFSST